MLNVLVVLPNSRGSGYLRKALQARTKSKALILPGMMGMDTFISELSEEQIINPQEAVLELFTSFRKLKNPNEQLSDFISLGQVLLSDFEDIIRNGRKPEEVFGELKRWAATGSSFSDFMDEEQLEALKRFSDHFEGLLSSGTQRFVDLWHRLPTIFADFQERLSQSGKTTSALAYSKASKQLASNSKLARYHHYCFAGFGNLTRSETDLMKTISELRQADFCWDIQTWYSDNPSHEVNRLFSRLRRVPLFQDSISNWEKKSSRKQRPTVSQIVCKGVSGMAQWVHNSHNVDTDLTALVATDPGLVHAVIVANAGDNFRFNVTMGFPLSYSPQAHWIQRIFQWVSRPVPRITSDIQWVLSDSHFTLLFPECIKIWNQIKSEKSYFTEDELRQILKNGPDWLWPQSAFDWVEKMRKWLRSIPAEKWQRGQEWAAWKNIQLCFEDLKTLSELPDRLDFSFSALSQLLPSVLYRYPIDITGSTEKGIQVMGLYESRLLDFDHVIIAPGEDGNIPTSNSGQTFLPDNIRKVFGLPTRIEKTEDEIYQFYRLTHRSKEITFLTGNDPGKKRSRILDQIEFGEYFPFEKKNQGFGSGILLPQPIQIEKTEYLLNEISSFFSANQEVQAKSFLSPSSIHSLLACPLRFYYQKICRLKKPDTYSDLEMNPMDFGNWMHTSIQKLLETFASGRNFIQTEQYDQMKNHWATMSAKVWMELRGKTSIGPLDSFEVEKAIGHIMADRFFDFMKSYQPHRWLVNEWSIPPKTLKENDRYWFVSGRADIIFETETSYEIFDLKTGSIKNQSDYQAKFKKDGTFPEAKILNTKDFFQMLMYNRMALDEPYFKGKPVRSVLFFLGNPSENKLVDPFAHIQNPEEEQKVLDAIDEIVTKRLKELADPTLPIMQTEDVKNCSYCDFSAICQR